MVEIASKLKRVALTLRFSTCGPQTRSSNLTCVHIWYVHSLYIPDLVTQNVWRWGQPSAVSLVMLVVLNDGPNSACSQILVKSCSVQILLSSGWWSLALDQTLPVHRYWSGLVQHLLNESAHNWSSFASLLDSVSPSSPDLVLTWVRKDVRHPSSVL